MRSHDAKDTVARIESLAREKRKLLRKLPDAYSINGDAAVEKKQIDTQIEDLNNKMVEEVDILLRCPPQHIRHRKLLQQLHSVAPFEKSVFIMTKYPEARGTSAKDDQLHALIELVKQSIKDAGFTPRLASDQSFHSLLWDNIELYLVGCARGVAIVESHYKPELNPNVAMEWGWMRAFGRPICFLLEKDATRHLRADWDGLLKFTFNWETPNQTIPGAIQQFLR